MHVPVIIFNASQLLNNLAIHRAHDEVVQELRNEIIRRIGIHKDSDPKDNQKIDEMLRILEKMDEIESQNMLEKRPQASIDLDPEYEKIVEYLTERMSKPAPACVTA